MHKKPTEQELESLLQQITDQMLHCNDDNEFLELAAKKALISVKLYNLKSWNQYKKNPVKIYPTVEISSHFNNHLKTN